MRQYWRVYSQLAHQCSADEQRDHFLLSPLAIQGMCELQLVADVWKNLEQLLVSPSCQEQPWR